MGIIVQQQSLRKVFSPRFFNKLPWAQRRQGQYLLRSKGFSSRLSKVFFAKFFSEQVLLSTQSCSQFSQECFSLQPLYSFCDGLSTIFSTKTTFSTNFSTVIGTFISLTRSTKIGSCFFVAVSFNFLIDSTMAESSKSTSLRSNTSAISLMIFSQFWKPWATDSSSSLLRLESLILIVLMVLFSPQKTSEDELIFWIVMYDLSRRIYECRDWMISCCFSITFMKSKQADMFVYRFLDQFISELIFLLVVFIQYYINIMRLSKRMINESQIID